MADCTNCKQDDKRYGLEAGMAALERSNRRWFIVCIVLIVALIVSWAGFIWYESQFDSVTQTRTVEQQADGDGNYHLVGGDYYGREAENNDNDADASP